VDHLKLLTVAFIAGSFGILTGSYMQKAETAESLAGTLKHLTTGEVVLSPGSVCVISADSDLDEHVFMGYLSSCRRAWTARKYSE